MTEQNYSYCNVIGRTDVGRKRAANEDSMGSEITCNGLVAVVCDGMGGHVGGATASKIAVNTILDNLRTNYYEDLRIAIGESIDKANAAILSEAQAHPELTGMGSTCVLLIVRDGKVYYGHVGDSRIYLVRSHKIVQLTKDHSFVQILVDSGEITKEQAEHHPRKNEITNALGLKGMKPATVCEDALIPEAGDCYLLCSDGLSGMVDDRSICKVVSRQGEMRAQARVDRLVELANENGGVDNITAQLVEFSANPALAAEDKARKLPLYAKVIGGCALAAILVAGGVLLTKRWGDGKDQVDQKELAGGGLAEDEQYEVIEVERNPLNSKEIISLRKEGDKVAFVSGGNVLKISEAELDINSYKVEPKEKIDSRFSDGVFTLYLKEEKADNPDDIAIIFKTKSAGTEDDAQIVKYIVKIANPLSGVRDNKQIGSQNILSQKNAAQSGGSSVSADSNRQKGEEQVVDSKEVHISYTALKEGDFLLINYFSEKPKARLNKGEESTLYESRLDETKPDVKHPENWKIEKNEKYKQLKFLLEKDVSGCQEFEILFFKDDSTTEMVLVKIILEPELQNGDVSSGVDDESGSQIRST